jgi:Ca2+-binding EF-hand superfamily protein
MRQIIAIFDMNRTGFLSRPEFTQVIKTLEAGISLEHVRLLMNFFDDKNTGKISVVDIVRTL